MVSLALRPSRRFLAAFLVAWIASSRVQAICRTRATSKPSCSPRWLICSANSRCRLLRLSSPSLTARSTCRAISRRLVALIHRRLSRCSKTCFIPSFTRLRRRRPRPMLALRRYARSILATTSLPRSSRKTVHGSRWRRRHAGSPSSPLDRLLLSRLASCASLVQRMTTSGPSLVFSPRVDRRSRAI